MRRAERARGQDGMARIDEPGHAVDRACRDRLGVVKRREDRFEGSREHRLPGPGWTDEEQIVATGRGDLERALGRLLPRNVRKIDRVRRRRGSRGHRRRCHAHAAFQVIDDLAKRREAERLDPARGGLARVRTRNKNLADAVRRGVTHAWHRPAHRAQRPVERELAETESGHVHAQLPARAEDSEGDRELEPGSFLAALRRREVHGNSTERELEPGVPHRGANALARFLHRRVR